MKTLPIPSSLPQTLAHPEAPWRPSENLAKRTELKPFFDEKGTFLRSFGWHGEQAGQLRSPLGIVVSQQGNYVVADSGNHRIQIFDSNGHFVFTFGRKGRKEGEMKKPPAQVPTLRFQKVKERYRIDENCGHCDDYFSFS